MLKALSTGLALLTAVLSVGLTAQGVTAPSAAASAACTGRPVMPASVEMKPGLVFAQADGQSLKLDLLAPRNASTPLPAIIFLHSGGFVQGQRTWGLRHAFYLASHGFVVAMSDYRLAPSSPFPAAINDAQSVARWLRTNAGIYNVDIRRVGVLGGSSGAYLAAVLGTNLWSGTDWSGARPDSQVQAVVAVNPVLFLPPVARMNIGELSIRNADGEREILWRPGLEAFLGSFEANAPRWQMASPGEHVSAQAAPFLFLHGTADPLYAQSVDMREKLERAHVRAELFTAEGAPHAVLMGEPWCAGTLSTMEAFLTSVLK